MDIEKKIFCRKRFSAGLMLSFGFTRTDGGYRYETDLMNGDFSAVLSVSDGGEVDGKVVDRMNGEEYRQLRFDGFQGAFVNSVRAAYEEMLCGIADACCKDVPFASDQANRIAELIALRYAVEPDFPWGRDEYPSGGVFRHGGNRKWFALIMNVKRDAIFKNGDKTTFDVVNLKADPTKTASLTERRGVYPAYHMNRKHWISVLLDDSLTDGEVAALVNDSFDLTK